MIRSAALIIILLSQMPSVAADERGSRMPGPDTAQISLIQEQGPKRHVFAGKHWLGVVGQHTHARAELEAGEYLLWTDDGGYTLVFLNSASRYYFELRRRRIEALTEAEAREMLDAGSTVSVATEDDRTASADALKKYPKISKRAAKKGLFAPCRFTGAKRAEYEKQAAAGDVEAQRRLGEMLWDGKCVWPDRAAAKDWFRQAAENGDDGAAVLLGNIHCLGKHTPKDPARGLYWYRTAAERGSVEAQRQLGWMYSTGRCVAADNDEAIKWYRRAWREHHDPRSKQRLERIDPVLREAVRAEAEARARAAALQEQARERARRREARMRLDQIRQRYGRLALAVAPMEGDVHLQRPRRKKTDKNVDVADGLDYLLPAPPGVMLGLVAAGMVFEAIESGLARRLSAADRRDIEQAARTVSGALAAPAVVRDLRQAMLDSTQLPHRGSIYKAVTYRPPAQGAARYAEALASGASLVLEVEPAGAGLVLVEKRYRPARFLMSNWLRLVRARDGVTLDQRFVCYASNDSPRFTDWAADDARLLRAELSSAYRHFARSAQLMLTRGLYTTDAEQDERCAALELAAAPGRGEIQGVGRR